MGSAAYAADDAFKHFEIKAKPLADALMEFGVQSGLTVVAPTTLTAGKKATAVRGELAPTDVLGRLLKGSGLTFARAADGTIAIQAIPSNGPVQASVVESGLDNDLTRPAALDEVVVTAQKRAQNLQQVGTSITAFDSVDLARLGFSDTTDVVRQVPGLQFQQFAPSITVLNIRGVSQNDFSDHQEAPVAVYSDEAYVASMGAISGSLFDTERVEVLRGPQGTLFGRNATGGLLHYISKAPTDTPEGYVEVTGGRFAQINTEGAISGPLAQGIDARFAFATARHDGIISNRIGPDGGSQNQYAARLQFLFKFDDDDSFLLKIHEIRNIHEVPTAYSWTPAYPNSQGLGVLLPATVNYWGTCPGCDIYGYRNPSSDPYNQAYGRSGAGIFDRSVYGATGRLTMHLGGVTLTSVTDHQRLNKRYGEDSDASPNLIAWYDSWQSYRQFSQELRLNGQLGPVNWIAGVYYLDMLSNDRSENPLPAFLGGYVGNLYEVKTRSGAVFSQGEWDITNHWTAILGARLTEDRKTDNYEFYAPTPATILYRFNPGLSDLAKRTWRLPSGKAELDYKFDKDVMLYASINRGVKGGGFAQPTAAAPANVGQLAFNPEKLTSYETGFKSTLLEGRARLNGDLFYYDYADYQAYTQEGLNQAIVNVQARVKGGELELAIVPARGLELRLGISALSTIARNLTLPAGQIADRVMPQAPKWSVNALARYQWTALSSTWSIEGDAKSDTATYFSTFNSPADREPAHSVANIRAGYTNSSGNVDVSVFCKNVTSRRYRVYDLDISSISIMVAAYAPPRWCGASFSYQWQ